MRKLLYLFLMLLWLISCTNKNVLLLEKAKQAWHEGNDSADYFLKDIDTASLTTPQLYEYYCIWFFDYNRLIALGADKADSITNLLTEYYLPGDEWFYHSRLLRILYIGLKHHTQADSLLDVLKQQLISQNDEIPFSWYNQKRYFKQRLNDSDSAYYYLHHMLKFSKVDSTYVYRKLGYHYLQIKDYDKAIAYYDSAIATTETSDIFSHYNNTVKLFTDKGEYNIAMRYVKAARKHLQRNDIPYFNLMKGDLFIQLHQPDSALHHYRIATETGNIFVATQAYERIGKQLEKESKGKDAFRMYQRSNQLLIDIYNDKDIQKEYAEFSTLELRNRINEMKLSQQQHVIIILVLSLCLLILTAGFLFYLQHRKKIAERKRLLQENLLLKQQEELSTLREKEAILREQDARMREELFKRMKVFEKLPIATKEENNKENTSRIHLSETDWEELRLMLDSTYNNFVQRFIQEYPGLSEKEINFCCLVKIQVSLQSLSDIYCISKNSVSRRKLRLKERLSITEGVTLDEFLQNY